VRIPEKKPQQVGNAPSTSASSASKKNSKNISFTNLSMKDFQLVRDLGSGSYGVVSLVNLHGNYYALKQVNKQKVLQVDKVANVHFERDVLQAASNPYFPNFNFTFQVSRYFIGL